MMRRHILRLGVKTALISGAALLTVFVLLVSVMWSGGLSTPGIPLEQPRW